MLSNKNKKVFTTLSYIEHFLTLVFDVIISIFISSFASLINISKGIMSSRIGLTIGLNIFAIIARIKKYKSMIKKKKKHDKIALLVKINLDCMQDLYRLLTDWSIECDYFHLLDLLRKYDYSKEEINKLESS